MYSILGLKNASSLAQRAGARFNSNSLREKFVDMIPNEQKKLKAFVAANGEKTLGNVTVGQAIGGARDVKCMYWETSLLDAQEGIRFRGHSIPELQKVLPTAIEGGEPIPEGLLYLLITGEVPTAAQAKQITEELHSRSALPLHVINAINNFPKNMHPMTQLASAVLMLQTESKFAKAYQEGVHKSKYWEATYEDVLDLLARLPTVASLIYRNTFHQGRPGAQYNSSLDYSANFAKMMGFTDPKFFEALRLYLTIHADHEGGNVSAHATRLVGSALSDPYLAFTAAMTGLAGPLHGLANQEVLDWVIDLQNTFKKENREVNEETISEYAWKTLNSGQVIPGYGHAVLRQTDPRYMAQREFCLKHLPNDELFKIVSTIYTVVPNVLKEHGKTKNPWPNVDAHSGVLLTHYGLTETNFYTVLFGVSRGFGVLSQLLWDRALGLAIERPKSLTLEEMAKLTAGQ